MRAPLTATLAIAAALLASACGGPLTEQSLIEPESDNLLSAADGTWSIELPCGDWDKSGEMCGQRLPLWRVKQTTIEMIDTSGELPPGAHLVDMDMHFLILDGEPPVMQLEHTYDNAPEDGIRSVFSYIALEPRRWNKAGDIIEARAWPVACRPYVEVDGVYRQDEDESLFPGLTPFDRPASDSCQVETLEAVLNASKSAPSQEDRAILRYESPLQQPAG